MLAPFGVTAAVVVTRFTDQRFRTESSHVQADKDSTKRFSFMGAH